MSKICTSCKIEKPLTGFHRASAGRAGHRNECKVCAGLRASRWREENRAVYNERARVRRSTRYSRLHHVAKQFGVTEQQYEALEVAQGHGCAVCRTPFEDMNRNPHVDHCHRTGKVRGLLCGGCNQAMGNVKDDPDRLRALADYLDRHAA